jgi:ribosomal protein L7/L12
MKIEITAHEYGQLLEQYASLVSRTDMAESQLKAVQAELAAAQKVAPSEDKIPTAILLKMFSEVFEAFNSKNKIQAIKRLRELTKCGLKEAKDTVESGMALCPNCARNGKQPLNHSCISTSIHETPSGSDSGSDPG